MIELNEVFDEGREALPVTNLYPKTKIPQIFGITTPDGAVALRMCSYTGGGDVNKNVKPGDKMMHAIVLGMSEKGTLIKLKNLGGDAIGVISTMFDLAAQTVKKYKMDAVMFRINKSKTGGQARAIQMILNRLVMSRLGGRFVILKELYDFDKKYVYVLIHRKNVDLSTIPGIPDISTELFTKVESAVGDVYVDVKNGTQVTKAEALAATIAAENDQRSDQSVIARAKVSRRQAIATQYGNQRSKALMTYNVRALEVYMDTQKKVPVYSASGKPSAIQARVKDEIKEHAKYMAQALRDTATGVDTSDKSDLRWNRVLGVRNRMINSFVGLTGINPSSDNEAELKLVLPTVNAKLEEVADIIENYDGVDTIGMYRKITAVMIRGTSADARFRESEIKSVIGEITATFNSTYSSAFKMQNGTPPRSMEEEKAIGAYCGSSFGEINDFLIGIESDASKRIYDEFIPTLDKCFETAGANKLDPGTVLYRGNKLDFENVHKSIENKLFYFPNFVSTSLHPIIFGGFANAFASLDTSAPSVEIEAPSPDFATSLKDVYQSALGQRAAEEPPEEKTSKIGIAFVIHGAEKINVLIPGRSSAFGDEAEVILPRGTTLRLNKAWGGNNKESVNGTWSQNIMIEATIVPPEQLDESHELYDGEALFESGEVVKIKEGSIYEALMAETFVDVNKTEQRTSYNEAMEALAGIVTVDTLEGTRFGS